jgi:hypothetical protein
VEWRREARAIRAGAACISLHIDRSSPYKIGLGNPCLKLPVKTPYDVLSAQSRSPSLRERAMVEGVKLQGTQGKIRSSQVA